MKKVELVGCETFSFDATVYYKGASVLVNDQLADRLAEMTFYGRDMFRVSESKVANTPITATEPVDNTELLDTVEAPTAEVSEVVEPEIVAEDIKKTPAKKEKVVVVK